MKNDLDLFLAAAKNISLRDDERRSGADAIGIRVRERDASRPQRSMGEKAFIKSAKRVTLSAAELARSKEFILANLERPHAAWWLNPFKSLTSITAAVLIVAIGGASASYAAESAMPGDLLYPVKIHVNEEMKTKLMTDPEASARWQAERAERRLQEAETLARRSALTEAARLTVAANFRAHARAVKDEVTALQNENNDAASAVGMDFEASLRAHARLLDTLTGEKSDQNKDISALLGDIHEARLDAEEDNVMVTMKKTPVAKTVLTDATLNRARAEVTLVEKSVAADASGDAGRSLKEAKKALDEAEKSDNMEQRMQRARAALRTAKEAGLFATSPAAKTHAKTMMKANEDAEAEDMHEDSDTALGAEVRMRITKKALKKLDDWKKPLDEDTAIRVETRVTGAKQLLDIATMQMEAGQEADALSASDMALKHAEAAEVTAEGKVDLAE